MQTFSSTRLAMGPIVFGLFFIFVIIIIAIAAARGLYGGRRVQRPMTEATVFPPPPPPDTVMVNATIVGPHRLGRRPASSAVRRCQSLSSLEEWKAHWSCEWSNNGKVDRGLASRF